MRDAGLAGPSAGMSDNVLLLLGDRRSPRLEARARRVIRVPSSAGDGELSSVLGLETLAWLRHRNLPVMVAGEGSSLIVEQLAQHGVAAVEVTAANEPAATTPGMDVADDVLSLIGNTPMVRLDRLYSDSPALVLGKLEAANPGGSIKDRVGVSLIDAAERDGLLVPGGHIVEPTSGNTGVGLAMVAARRGYRCTFTVPDKVAPEKIALLRAYGAEVRVCPTNVAADDPRSYYSVAQAVAQADPKAFRPDQYSNPANPLAHIQGTGPEIWEQTAGRVTHVIAGAGTGGTLGGIGRYLKDRNPSIVMVAADPVGSVYSGGNGEPYLVEGIGEDFWPGNWDAQIVDEVLEIADDESFAWARRAARVEGLLLGGSCGAALAAAGRVAARAQAGDVIVVVLPDGGRGYLSKLYNDTWMQSHGFPIDSGDEQGASVRSVLDRVALRRPALVHTHPGETVGQVAAIMSEYGLHAIPVLSVEAPRVPGQVVGSHTTSEIATRLSDPTHPAGPGLRSLPLVGVDERCDAVSTRFDDRRAVLVVDRGRPVGVLTDTDLLDGIV